MQLAARPYLTAGVALAGAGIIAAPPVAQHLPEIQASEVRLANAEESITDLFSGAANGAANLASAASAADVPGSLFSPLAAAAGSDPYFVNPLQTWVDVFANSAANLQTIGADWANIPAVLAQQVAANWIEYANLYVGAYQAAANGAVNFYTSVAVHGTPTTFWPLMTTILSDFQTGDLINAFEDLGYALIQGPIQQIFEPMEQTLNIPVDITQNIATTTSNLIGTQLTSGISALGASLEVGAIPSFFEGLGAGLQPAYDAFAAGDFPGGVLNVLNTPGVAVDYLLNGVPGGGATGLLSPENGSLDIDSGLLSVLVNYIPQQLAAAIPVSGAANITEGGSLATGWGAFVNQLINGWPQANQIVDNIVALINYLSPADFGNAAAAVGALPIDVAGIAPSIAADLSGLLPSIATGIAGTLPTELGTLAANILTSLL